MSHLISVINIIRIYCQNCIIVNLQSIQVIAFNSAHQHLSVSRINNKYNTFTFQQDSVINLLIYLLVDIV